MNATHEQNAPVIRARSVTPAKRKIMLVNDDPAIRQILLRLLEENDYLVLTAAKGVEAIEVATAAKPDLVLLDLNMPIKDGWETFKQL